MLLALSALLWWAIFWAWDAFAQPLPCESRDIRVMLRPIAETAALCEIAGARRGAYACTIPAGPDQPATVLFPTPDSWAPPLRQIGFAWDHELRHAVCGLPAERVS